MKDCDHNAYALVNAKEPGIGEILRLYCYNCKKELRYHFYEETEWNAVVAHWKVMQRLPDCHMRYRQNCPLVEGQNIKYSRHDSTNCDNVLLAGKCPMSLKLKKEG